MTSILVVDDSAVDRRLVGELLERRFECSVDYAVNGLEAMALLKELSPDLVVTDLTMPEMNGLELVTSVRKHFPELPIILMTAYGSETLSIEALEKGAASYVPKSRLADKLPDTAKEVLTLAKADRCHAKLINCLDDTRFTFTLDNDPALVDPLVDLIQQMVSGMGPRRFHRTAPSRCRRQGSRSQRHLSWQSGDRQRAGPRGRARVDSGGRSESRREASGGGTLLSPTGVRGNPDYSQGSSISNSR